jgi:peptide chain release factor 2
MEAMQKIQQESKLLRGRLETYEKLKRDFEDAITMAQLGLEEQDEETALEASQMAQEFKNFYNMSMRDILLSGEYDKNNAIVTLHPGAGGTEACDWAEMLYRMFTKWSDKKGYRVSLLDYLPGEEAGIKSVTFMVEGINAYGYLKCEKGIHRLVRISPFDASGRRHTSFASCDVMPELPDDFKMDIDPDDLRIDTFRSSGAGGQHVNKTESAIRITHIPTNIVVQCQNERSQFKNRDVAMKVLYARLLEVRSEERMQKMHGIRGEIKDNAFGSQIRSYVFHPYNMCKDHRTGAETGNVLGVMDGGLDMFIDACLIWRSQQKIQSEYDARV